MSPNYLFLLIIVMFVSFDSMHAMSRKSSSSYPLLSKLKTCDSKEWYIQYLTNLEPGIDRYLIGGESIEKAKEYTSKSSKENAERALICIAAYLNYKQTRFNRHFCINLSKNELLDFQHI